MKQNILQDQFVKIIDENKKIIFKICNIYSNNKEDRKDLFHDIILQLWISYPSFEGRSKISSWIYRVALNTSLNHLRTMETKNQFKLFPIHLFTPSNEYYPDCNENNELLQLLEESMDKLNDIDKAILLLYLDEKSYNEIANIIGITKTNVGTRINRIKEKLKKLY